MNGRAFAAIFAAISICIALLGRAGAQPVTPEMFGALPDVSEVAISPDGSTIAMLQSAGKANGVIFYDVANPSVPQKGVSLGDSQGRGIRWVDDDHLLMLVSQSSRVLTRSGSIPTEFWRWVSVSRSRGDVTVLLGNEAGFYLFSAGTVLSDLPQDTNRVLLARWTSRFGGRAYKRGYSLLSVDLDTGNWADSAYGDRDTIDWAVTAQGDPFARVDYNSEKKEVSLYVKEAGERFMRLVSTSPVKKGEGAPYSLYGVADDGKDVVATSTNGGDKLALVEMSRESGAVERVLLANAEYDVASVIYNSRTAKAEGVRYIDDLPRSLYIDPAHQKVHSDLIAALPDGSPLVTSQSADRSRMIVRMIYTDHPDQIFLFDARARRLTKIAATYGGLDGKVYAAKEKYDYISADGLRIPGYLTVPAGASKQKMPLIVLPHGGPWARDDQAFDWWPFFYAARGYLVYQPNFRGSEGYGESFRLAGKGEWGRKMQGDITEGVNKLIADGIVDPERVCIVGASYGGYAALMGATSTPDLYACVVSVNGVSNLVRMLGEARASQVDDEDWEILIGDRANDDASIKEASPAENAAKVQAPILLIHGKSDSVVEFRQSTEMRRALTKAKKPHEFVELKGEDHWLSRGATRTEMLARSIEFIDKHIGGNQQPATGSVQ